MHQVKQMFKDSNTFCYCVYLMADIFGVLQIEKVAVSATASLSPLMNTACRENTHSLRLKVKTSGFVCVFCRKAHFSLVSRFPSDAVHLQEDWLKAGSSLCGAHRLLCFYSVLSTLETRPAGLRPAMAGAIREIFGK